MVIKDNIPDETSEPSQQGDNKMPVSSPKEVQQTQPKLEEEIKVKSIVRGDENVLTTAGRDVVQNFYLYGSENLNLNSLPNRIVNIDEDLPKWFSSLDEYGKFYALAVCFYQGVKSSDFLKIPPIIKSHLIKSGEIEKKKEAPSRNPSVKTMEVRDPDKHALVIKFPKDSTSGEILFLVMKNYASLLFSFIPVLNEIVQSSPENWELRWRSSVALGQISELDVDHILENVISKWVDDEKAYVRATVGYYYYYIFSLNKEDNPAFKEIWSYALKTFERWANPKNFDDKYWRYKWTTAAICEKVGLLEDAAAETFAKQYIEKIAGINHIRVADSVIHALVEWSIKQKFQQVFKLLVSWVESGSAGDQDENSPYKIRCIVALVAFNAIIEVNYDLFNDKDNEQESISPVDVLRIVWENRFGEENYWNGMVSIGVRNFNFRMSHYFFDMLESWTEIISDKEFLADFISSWLKDIYFNVRSKTYLENRLKNIWAKSKNKTLKSIAQLTQEKLKKGI